MQNTQEYPKYSELPKILKQSTKYSKNTQFINPKYGHFDERSVFMLFYMHNWSSQFINPKYGHFDEHSVFMLCIIGHVERC